MPASILATKLHLPSPRPHIVRRPHLLARLNEGLRLNDGFGRKLTLISAAAGCGKTTLVSAWVAALQASPGSPGEEPGIQAAWLALDEGDSDPTRFLTYLIAALQTVAPLVGQGALTALQAPQSPPPEAILTAVLNDIAALPDRLILVLDDYHAVDARPVDDALGFLLQHLPPRLHLVIATREDPALPLARLRAQGQLTELRAADLRFTPAEAAEFLNQAMGLHLAAAEVAALEARTEGWIAGLHLAALSLQGREDTAAFVAAFSGSHRFVLDYLVEEVLSQQPAGVQDFLLRTAVLDHLCGPLCDALAPDAPAAGQETLAHLDRANLFVVPLDNDRRWYRYHHLFGELLRQRLHQQHPAEIAGLHIRASIWYEDNGLEIEAFHHAAAAQDLDRAERLLAGKGMPLLFRGAVRPILNWLAALPTSVLDARPGLWVTYASALLFIQQVAGVEEKLQAAEAALADAPLDDDTRDLHGHMASIRATVAVTQHDVATILAQSRRALDYLHPHNLPVRTAAKWSLAYAHHLQGDRAAAGQAYAEASAASQAMGHYIIHIMATLGLANIQEVDTHLAEAAATYRRALELAGDPPLPLACGAHLGLARINYQWGDLEAAQRHGEESLRLARQIPNTDRAVAAELFLARLKLAQGDVSGAVALAAAAGQAAEQQNFVLQLPEAAAVRTLILLRQGNPAAAVQLAQAHDLPLSAARALLAQGDAAAAVAMLATYRQHAEARGWGDERLKALVLQAAAQQVQGDREEAVRLLAAALALAEPAGFVRLFVDEGPPLAQVMAEAAARGIIPDYATRLLAAFAAEKRQTEDTPQGRPSQPLSEPLSERELEVLQLIAQGLSNQEIGERLFLALDTVKGHNRRIFDKLEVQRRTEAVARARALGLL
jgi:LuxR family maltose regulon positive regulatory protein